jgi:hypothetical protein
VKPARTVLLIAAVLFICNIWGYDLWAPDEPFFGEGAREMVVDGQWVVTHVNGKVNTHKPPFFFWLIALLSLPLGRVTSLTARLPSALASLGTVAMVLRLGRRTSSERTAVLAAFILATTYMFWDKARSVQIDAAMCCLIWVSLSAFEAWRAGDLEGRRAGLIFWASAACPRSPVHYSSPRSAARGWRRPCCGVQPSTRSGAHSRSTSWIEGFTGCTMRNRGGITPKCCRPSCCHGHSSSREHLCWPGADATAPTAFCW